jgi:SEC-C motif-containing protein
VFAEVDYLIATHPDSLTPLLQRRKELRKNCREAHWLGLKIKAVEAGGVDDLEGTVTFEATFGASGQCNVMAETSLFQRRDGSLKGNWLYIKPL